MESHILTPRIDMLERRFDTLDNKIDGIGNVEVAIREMSLIAGSMRKEIDKNWERIDDMNSWREAHIALDTAEHKQITEVIHESSQRFSEMTHSIESKVDGWINQARGVGMVLAWVGGLLQSIIIGGVAWQFHAVTELQARMVQIEIQFEEHRKQSK